MSTFIEMESYEKIIELLHNYKRILIIGCTKCANISISYTKGYPLASQIIYNGIPKWKPYAIFRELQNIKSLLTNINKTVILELDCPCLLTDSKDYHRSLERTDIDAIICVNCAIGKIGIQKTVGDAFPVILAAHTAGQIQYHIDIDNNNLLINQEKSTVVKYNSLVKEHVDLEQYWRIVNKTMGV